MGSHERYERIHSRSLLTVPPVPPPTNPDSAPTPIPACEDDAMLVRFIAELYRRLPIKSGVTRLSFNPIMNRLTKGYSSPYCRDAKGRRQDHRRSIGL
jgi:hypothetical protein